MKTSTFYSSLLLILTIICTSNIHAQKFAGLDKSPLDITYYRTSRNATPMVKVIYSRPQLKGRPLSQLAPNDKVWRTGANEATEIKFYQDTKFGGETVKAGTYSLFTIPGDKEWTIILSSDTDVWGAYNYNQANDIIRVEAPVSSGDSVEAFSIAFDDGKMYMAWDTVRAVVPVSI